MELSEMQERAAELEQQISALPAGSITKKTVNGKEYFYHRWTENKKRREKYIPADELEDFRAQIERRKALEQELKALKKQFPQTKTVDISAFTTNIRIGEALRSFAAPVRGYRKRECFRQLHDFVYGELQDKVFILYGLRRTGKTTMIRQIFAEMSDAELAKAAFIQITAKDTLANVNHDLKQLEAHGFCYVFLDEVTLMEDFIEGAALFSDVFAACGMKIVLSGTDSLGFLFTEDEDQLAALTAAGDADDLLIFDAHGRGVLLADVQVALGDDDALAQLDLALRPDQLTCAGALDVAALADGCVDAEVAGVGGGELDLIGLAHGAEDGDVGLLTLGADDGQALVAGELARVGQVLALGQLIALAEQLFHRLLRQVDVTGGCFNHKRHSDYSFLFFFRCRTDNPHTAAGFFFHNSAL